jgi:glycerol-3-phosphate responsive antiterminator
LEPELIGARSHLASLVANTPRLLVAVRDNRPHVLPSGTGLLFHDLSLDELIRLSADADAPLAADLDSIEGLTPDLASITFLLERLRVTIMITKRPALAQRAAKAGCLSLLHVHCLDSTGLDRALGAHPGPPVGTAISPGLILPHLAADELQRLPRPLLAFGLIRRHRESELAFAAGADAVVLEDAGQVP